MPQNASMRAFAAQLASKHPQLEASAAAAEALVRDLLRDSHIDLHQITSRVKSQSSILLKAMRKGYRYPARQFTDIIGVRVVTYYESDVNPVTQLLAEGLRIHARKSVDKRSMLGPAEFGYRSVHLIAQATRASLDNPQMAYLRGLWFEIQIRSLLEHAWAAIDHEVVYKSQVQFPDTALRRFASIAGTLEMLDREFAQLRVEVDTIVETHKRAFASGTGLTSRLDSARLIALMEVIFPNALGWRAARETGDPFPRFVEVSCLAALSSAGITTGRGLMNGLKHPSFSRARRKFAANKRIAPQDVSHLAALALLIGTRKQGALADFLPDYALDPDLAKAI